MIATALLLQFGRFNEAGADCPGMQLPNTQDSDTALASMRPGQTAPECCRNSPPSLLRESSFNEAGADCPGMRQSADSAQSAKAELQ